jgi:hypothetical protein
MRPEPGEGVGRMDADDVKSAARTQLEGPVPRMLKFASLCLVTP